VKRSGLVRRVKVSADGVGVVSHAGVGLLREMAACSGLVDAVTGALMGTYKGIAPGLMEWSAPGSVELCCWILMPR
jgi:hypothetical protein